MASSKSTQRNSLCSGRPSSGLTGSVTSAVFPVAELFARTQALRTWLIGREQNAADDEGRARFGAALIQCAELDELLRASGARVE